MTEKLKNLGGRPRLPVKGTTERREHDLKRCWSVYVYVRDLLAQDSRPGRVQRAFKAASDEFHRSPRVIDRQYRAMLEEVDRQSWETDAAPFRLLDAAFTPAERVRLQQGDNSILLLLAAERLELTDLRKRLAAERLELNDLRLELNDLRKRKKQK